MNLVGVLDKIISPSCVYAHCDIPCGIYDPHNVQVAAHTVIRMTNMIDDLKASSDDPDFNERKRIISQIVRLTAVKEEHAEMIKHGVRVIWGDYFKEEHLKKYPKLHSLVFDIMKQASFSKQNAETKAAEGLLDLVLEFSEIFWETKGRETTRIKLGYPTEREIVLPK